MLKKTISYVDFDGTNRTEDHFFNLTKAEMAEYNASYEDRGGILNYLTWLIENKKQYELILAFKELILRSYGERNANGRFVKSQEIRDAFMATEAYSTLFMEIADNEDAAAAFINGLFSGIPELRNQNVTPIPAPVG